MLQEPEDRLFERWCRRGDAAALGALFDATAARLLKLAIHLVGDPCAAEDLVQATFLAALEQRASLDPARPAMPWLTGVLAHQAQQHRRRAARVPDPSRLETRVVEDPSRPLERRELDGEVARAIDEVEEPYRSVLILRVRHGLELADVAHVLERDPGTVRVQLHRGLEKLRAKLPERMVSALFALELAPRGLEAVRALVVQQAAAAVSVGTIGGGLVAKKLLAAAVLALALVAVWLTRRASGTAGAEGEAGATPELASTPPARALEPAVAPASPAGPAVAARAPAAPGGAELRGRVLDAETHEPLAGVALRYFAPRRAPALELVRAQPELYQRTAHGALETTTGADWPLVEVSSALARFGREPATAYGRPLGGDTALSSARSAADGSFALAAGVAGVLEGARDGYATRWRAVRSPAEELVLELWRARELRGVVLGADGAPVGAGLEFVLVGIQTPRFEPEPEPDTAGAVRVARAFERDEIAGLGAWPVRTDAEGSFSALVGADSVTTHVLTEGWDLGPMPYVDPAEQELVVRALRVPRLHVVDAQTTAPLERVRLLGRNPQNRVVYVTGEFAAPGGFLELPCGGFFAQHHAGDSLALLVWDDDHEPARLTLADFGQGETIEVRLEPGRSETLDGSVRRAGVALAGVEVALLPYRQGWGIEEDLELDATRTDAEGRFHLEAPSGSYVVRVRETSAPFFERVSLPDHRGTTEVRIAGREPLFERVVLPCATPLALDFDRFGRIDVELLDAGGSPLAGLRVSLVGPDERFVSALSDADGHAPFANLPAGKHRLYADGLDGSSESREVELAASGREHVSITFGAPSGPRHIRVVARDTGDYAGWRARLAGERWSTLEPDGTVPLDLNQRSNALEILAPDERHWHLDVPEDAADGHVFELEPGDGRYRGVLLRDDGSPWPGVAVHAVPWSAELPLPRVSAVTDATGAFELPGLTLAEHHLMFNTQVERSPWDEWSNALAGVIFLPLEPPSPAGTRLEVRVAEVDRVRVRGTIEHAGRPLADAYLSFECAQPVEHGTLVLGGMRACTRSDERGAFELELPRTPRVTAYVALPSPDGWALVQPLGPLADGAELRLVVP